MFDGCMVDGDYYENTEIISKIETYINNKWKNLNISVATKPHETTIPEIPDDYEIPTTVVNSGPLFPTFEEVAHLVYTMPHIAFVAFVAFSLVKIWA